MILREWATQRAPALCKTARLLMLTFLVWMIFYGPLSAKEIEDVNITVAVERELLNHGGVRSHLIDVETYEGTVTLSGSVDTLPGKELATELAETVKGVRAVVNRIDVRSFGADRYQP